MADKYFTNFPEIQYQLADGKIVYIKDFFRKSRIEQEAVNSIVEYNLYNIPDGDRPDITATKLYGNANLHWTFFLVNDFDNYYDWYKDQQTFERYIEKKYPGQYAIATLSTDIVVRKLNDADETNKFLLGEKITSVSTEGRVTEVLPGKNRIAIDGGNFVADEAITGTVSTKSFTTTSVINHKDGVAYYKNGDLRKNQASSGYTSVSLYDDEYEKNEAKRKIKVISPSIISNVVRRFETVMTS